MMEGLGATAEFVCAKCERYQHKSKSNPKWESKGTFGNGREKCAAFPLKKCYWNFFFVVLSL